MAKRRICEDKLGTGEAEVRLVGWGSSLLDKASDPSPNVSCNTVPHAWDTPTETLKYGEQVSQVVRERMARVMTRNNRRHQPRLAHPADIHIQQFSCAVSGTISAEVRNFSRGGICITSRVPLMGGTVVQCQIGVPDMQFAIPTLMQVVWVESTGAEYEIGLRYVV